MWQAKLKVGKRQKWSDVLVSSFLPSKGKLGDSAFSVHAWRIREHCESGNLWTTGRFFENRVASRERGWWVSSCIMREIFMSTSSELPKQVRTPEFDGLWRGAGWENRVRDREKEWEGWSSHCGAAETNPTGNHEVAGLIPGPTQWVTDLALQWVWCRSQMRLGSELAVAVVQAGSCSSNLTPNLGISICLGLALKSKINK